MFIAKLIGKKIDDSYILPFDIPVPLTTTTTRLSTTSTTMPTTTTTTTTTTSASSMPTTPKDAARSIHLNNTEKIIFAFVSVLVLYLFEI
ncbi:unnamed protein product [Rotaria sp. Silwood1]|nr:unnamed protein product [Rotaria sp. Silwood1]